MKTAPRSPVYCFSVRDFDIDVEHFVAHISDAFYDLPWDEYLVRQQKIEFLKQRLSGNQLNGLGDEFWSRFYQGDIDEMSETLLLSSLHTGCPSFLPTRRRAISLFELTLSDRRWQVERRSCSGFGQCNALVDDARRQDYRVSPRNFAELDDSLVNDDLITLLRSVASRVHEARPDVPRLEIAVHHTQIVVRPGESATNAPEGIHQDGMDYIVSALVVERNNIQGGTSIVYASDKRTRLFETTLQSGQGLFQPDRGSDLWHTVTPIQPVNEAPGYRSSIGFDITLKQ
ncbi:2OG-Fe dioxygenase family protein [Phytohalomonas tamaricis]|uniref:2OG-Fe dioxygenase family protein n=1 Tax=Phytohalomonas tamaricis TaxID=2081032 RepID=UPI001319FA4C|nr:2OG-Fe dioxygenase family protein [Phytohalomonas tamaricis]